MTKKKPKEIISFFPDARGFGYAYMKNENTLLDFQIVNPIPLKNSKIIERLKTLIAEYSPDVIVLENYNGAGSNKSKRVKKLIDLITEYAENKNIPVEVYSREQIRFVFSNFNAKNKFQISQTLAQHFPILESRLQPKRKIFQSESYYMPVFDAVAHHCVGELPMETMTEGHCIGESQTKKHHFKKHKFIKTERLFFCFLISSYCILYLKKTHHCVF